MGYNPQCPSKFKCNSRGTKGNLPARSHQLTVPGSALEMADDLYDLLPLTHERGFDANGSRNGCTILASESTTREHQKYK